MFTENQFVQWIFKHDEKTLFIIFCMRVAGCNQPPHIKENILNKGLEIIRERLNQKIKHLQVKQKLDEISPEFHSMIEKIVRKTLSYDCSSSKIAALIKGLVEINIKDENPQGILHYLNKIPSKVNFLLVGDKKAQYTFQQFWLPIEQHTYSFVSSHYRNQMNQSPLMVAWMRILAFTILIAAMLMLLKEISLVTGLWIIGSAIMTNYLSRSAWRLTAFLQYKPFLSKEALQESNRIVLDLISLQQLPSSKPIKQPKNEQQEKSQKEINLLPAWHQTIETITYKESSTIRQESNKPKRKRSSVPEKAESNLPLSFTINKASKDTLLKWKETSPVAIYDPLHPEISNTYPLNSGRFTYTPLFSRLNPGLADVIPNKDFTHFQKIVERGRLIPSKSKGMQGIKPAFQEYQTFSGQTAFSDYIVPANEFSGKTLY